MCNFKIHSLKLQLVVNLGPGFACTHLKVCTGDDKYYIRNDVFLLRIIYAHWGHHETNPLFYWLGVYCLFFWFLFFNLSCVLNHDFGSHYFNATCMFWVKVYIFRFLSLYLFKRQLFSLSLSLYLKQAQTHIEGRALYAFVAHSI